MKWWNRHWYEVGLVSAMIAAIILIVNWSNFAILARVGLINFIGIMLHQFEEYGYPGGTPVFMNIHMRGGNERYPLNQLSAMIVNIAIAYICYLLPVFFPDILWLGMAPILFGCVFQIIMHVAVFVSKYHRFYNPGLGAVLLIHVPCGIYYIWYVLSRSLMMRSDWVYTILYLIAMIIFTAVVGQFLFSSKDSKHPFDQKEIEAGERFAKMMHL